MVSHRILTNRSITADSILYYYESTRCNLVYLYRSATVKRVPL